LAKYQGVTSKTAFGYLASDLRCHFPKFCPASLEVAAGPHRRYEILA